MENKLFLDTSTLYALFDESDEGHHKIVNYIKSSTETFYISNFIIDELITLLRYRSFSVKKIKPFIEKIWDGSICTVIYVTPDIEKKAWAMLNKYNDQKLSFTDCTSFTIMKENEISKVCSLDRHFLIPGFLLVP